MELFHKDKFYDVQNVDSLKEIFEAKLKGG